MGEKEVRGGEGVVVSGRRDSKRGREERGRGGEGVERGRKEESGQKMVERGVDMYTV